MANALSIQNLQKVYSNGTEALKSVSLEIEEGDFFALLGPNGAGKTTIIGIATGLVNKTAGSVKVFGHDIDEEPEKAKVQIGVVQQEVNFNPFEKCIDIVVNQAGYYGIPRSLAIPRAKKLFEDLGIADKMEQKGMELSGGMKRRLMIARALVHEPKILILDEPTAGVDVELRRGMWDYLRSVTTRGVTILLTTHYLEEAEQLCKNVAIINRGEIIASGTMKDILGRLKGETVLIDLTKPVPPAALAALASYKAKKVDENTIEAEIGEGRGLNDAILALHRHDLKIESIRSKTGRLEEVFVKLTSNNDE
ncbi:MAG: ABC transporter ATP-binding protein [Patescibacteria group bacterium]